MPQEGPKQSYRSRTCLLGAYKTSGRTHCKHLGIYLQSLKEGKEEQLASLPSRHQVQLIPVPDSQTLLRTHSTLTSADAKGWLPNRYFRMVAPSPSLPPHQLTQQPLLLSVQAQVGEGKISRSPERADFPPWAPLQFNPLNKSWIIITLCYLPGWALR